MMNITILLDFERFCLAGYLCAVACLNVTMYLIAAFYNKKFGEPTPRLGFIFSIILSLLCALTVFAAAGDGKMLGALQAGLVILAAIASMISSTNLFLKMRKPRK